MKNMLKLTRVFDKEYIMQYNLYNKLYILINYVSYVTRKINRGIKLTSGDKISDN